LKPQLKSREKEWVVANDAGDRHVIEISSDSTESETCRDTSSVADAIDLEDEEQPAVPVDAGVEEREVEILARNLKTKIIHECRNDTHVSICDQSSFDEVMIGALTSCGRVMTSSYKLVFGPLRLDCKVQNLFQGQTGTLDCVVSQP
jgi:hypothetical protein